MELVSLTAVVCAAGIGAFASIPVVRIAKRRALAQPLPVDRELELSIVKHVEETGAGASIAGAGEWFCDRELAGRFSAALVLDGEDEDEPLRSLLEKLEHLHTERERFPGACGYVRFEEPPFIKRGEVTVSARRVRGAAVACAGSTMLAALATENLWMFAAVSLLGLLGWVIALVDHDTLFLDLPLWWLGGPAAMLLSFLGAHQRDGWFGILVACVCGAAWWITFEAMNLGYRLIRGIDGVGGGDGMIVFVTVSVAVAVTGSATIGMWAVLLSLFAALVASAPAVVRKERGGRDAFALGPFLACGWQLAVLAHWAGILS